MYCPNCGKYTEQDVKFCPECGQSIAGDSSAPQPNKTSAFGQTALYAQHKKRVLVAVLLNVLWAGAGCFYAREMGKAGIYTSLTLIAWFIIIGASEARSDGGVTFGLILVFVLFLGSCATSTRGVEVFNVKLLERLDSGKTRVSDLLKR